MEKEVVSSEEKTITIGEINKAFKDMGSNLRVKSVSFKGRGIPKNDESCVISKSGSNKIVLYDLNNPDTPEEEYKGYKKLSKAHFEKSNEASEASSNGLPKTVDELNKELKDNDCQAVVTKRKKDAEIKLAKGRKGRKEDIMLTCTKPGSGKHDIVRTLNTVFNSIKKHEVVCKQGHSSKSSENSKEKKDFTKFEEDISNGLKNSIVLKKLFPNYDWNGKINYGQNNQPKQSSGIPDERGGFLDFDIFFRLPEIKNGYDKVAIMIDGPNHNATEAYWQTRKNDIKRIERIVEASKNKENSNVPEPIKNLLFISVPVNAARDEKYLKSEAAKAYKRIKAELERSLGIVLNYKNKEAQRNDAINEVKQKLNISSEAKLSSEQKAYISKQAKRKSAGQDRQRNVVLDTYSGQKADVIGKLRRLHDNKLNQITYRKKKYEDKRVSDTEETSNLYDFVVKTNEGEKSLNKYPEIWAELLNNNLNPRVWMNKHQGHINQINYNAERYPGHIYEPPTKEKPEGYENKGLVKLFEEIKRRASK